MMEKKIFFAYMTLILILLIYCLFNVEFDHFFNCKMLYNRRIRTSLFSMEQSKSQIQFGIQIKTAFDDVIA